jgi:uncharacterized protein YndB with AHSA1/START domain
MNTSDTKITIQATVLANNQKVWDCYTSPKHITGWNFAHESWHCPAASNDLRPGGKYSARMEAKDGSFGFEFEAIYNEIVPLKKIVYTMTDGRQATVLFETGDNQTDVTVIFDPETQNSIDLQREGWQAILNNFKKYAEKC